MLRYIWFGVWFVVLTGWIVPGWLGWSFLEKARELEQAGTAIQHSFPFEYEGKELLVIGAVWLVAGVLLFAFSRLKSVKRFFR